MFPSSPYIGIGRHLAIHTAKQILNKKIRRVKGREAGRQEERMPDAPALQFVIA